MLARLDWVMLGAVVVLVAYGLWSISGITQHDVLGSPDYYVYRQIVFIAVGTLGMVLAILIDPDIYRRYQKQLYLGTLLLFVFVFMAGTVARGSRRWIDLGFFRFQPSEFGKLLVVLALAGYLADRYRRVGEARVVLTTIALALPPMVLVFIQPDIGSALVYVRRALRRPVRGRHPLAPPRDPRAHHHRASADRPLVAARGRHARAEGVPEGPPDRLPPLRHRTRVGRPTT